MYADVHDWLYTIGLDHLFDFFIQDGFTTLESVRNMRQSDIDAIVDRHGYMVILNEEIDKLNYGGVDTGVYSSGARASSVRAGSYAESELDYEPRETILSRYETGGIPAVGFASRHLARRAKSMTRKTRGGSAFPALSRVSSDRYVANSASDAFESFMASKRAASVAVANARDAELNATLARIEQNQRKREEDRQRRAKTEMHYLSPDEIASNNLDRSKFRDHYTNEYVWVEKNHITDVGVKYDGLSRKVDHKPSHWRCEDEIERGKEYKRMNDECADKIADNRFAIENSRDWLVNDGGIVDRVHRMSAKTQKTRYDLDSIRRNMDNLKAMRTRLLKY